MLLGCQTPASSAGEANSQITTRQALEIVLRPEQELRIIGKRGNLDFVGSVRDVLAGVPSEGVSATVERFRGIDSHTVYRITAPDVFRGYVIRWSGEPAVSGMESREQTTQVTTRFCPIYGLQGNRLVFDGAIAANTTLTELQEHNGFSVVIGPDGILRSVPSGCLIRLGCNGASFVDPPQTAQVCAISDRQHYYEDFAKPTWTDLSVQGVELVSAKVSSVLKVPRPAQVPNTVVADPTRFLEWIFIGATLADPSHRLLALVESAARKILENAIEAVGKGVYVFEGIEGYPKAELTADEFAAVLIALNVKVRYPMFSMNGLVSVNSEEPTFVPHRAATKDELLESYGIVKSSIENYSASAVTTPGTKLRLVGYEAELRRSLGLSEDEPIPPPESSPEWSGKLYLAIQGIADSAGNFVTHHLTRLFNREYAVVVEPGKALSFHIVVGHHGSAQVRQAHLFLHSHPSMVANAPDSGEGPSQPFYTSTLPSALVYFNLSQQEWNHQPLGDLYASLNSITKDIAITSGVSGAQANSDKPIIGTYMHLKNLPESGDRILVPLRTNIGRVTLSLPKSTQ